MKIVPIDKTPLDTFIAPCLDFRPVEKVPADFPSGSENHLEWIQARREERRSFFQYLIKKYGTAGLVALSRRKPLGWMTFFPKDEARRIGWIRAADDYFNQETLVLGCFYVEENGRKKDVGSQLIGAWKKWARDNYWRYIEAAPRTNRDEPWYDPRPFKKAGFVFIEERMTSLESQRSFGIYRCDLLGGEVKKWVQVWEDQPFRVEVVKSFLESNGIPTYLESEVVSSLHPFTQGPLGEVRVKVPEQMQEKAEKLLKEVHEGDG